MSTLPKLFSSPSSKIFSTNKENIVEVNNDRIIESDSEFREVVKQGYLLNMINLSTIPDIIADAIADAIIDAKDLTLADSLLSTLRTDLENLDDGVYKKTYIDNTITYLEDLLTSKVDAETVASIADSKIAIASEGFAATSTVNLLTSRVDSSESAITSLAETVNTKDTARANQISSLEASIDESFSGYSEAIDLVVESDGSVRAKKIEDLRVEFESEIGLVNASIADTNELIVEKDGEWKASSMKLITNPYGGITGYSFQDGSGLKSNFTINADTFKISNSTNTYTPFSIVDNNLLFNGKVTFSNITGGDSILTVDNVQDAINNNVTSIDGGKIVTNAAFVNNLNATGGIVADYVNANEMNGLTINGGIFNGARINGAVIKASYLDLDGELEVLTNYHISVATYNASPSTYSDAVYISSDNEYRIPSWSTIKNTAGFGNLLSNNIRSYNNANSGHNSKCVKINPQLNIVSKHMLFSCTYNAAQVGAKTFYRLYLCGLEQAIIYAPSPSSNAYLYLKDSRSGISVNWNAYLSSNQSSSSSLSLTLTCGMNLRIEYQYTYTDGYMGDEYYRDSYMQFSIYIESSTITLPTSYTSGELMTFSSSYGTNYYPSNMITINNMI